MEKEPRNQVANGAFVLERIRENAELASVVLDQLRREPDMISPEPPETIKAIGSSKEYFELRKYLGRVIRGQGDALEDRDIYSDIPLDDDVINAALADRSMPEILWQIRKNGTKDRFAPITQETKERLTLSKRSNELMHAARLLITEESENESKRA